MGSSTPRGPEGIGGKSSLPRATGDEDDVQGHGSTPRDVKAIPADEPGTEPQAGRHRLPRAGGDDADVEGHNFGHNPVLSRQAAQSREREIQRNLRQHDVKSEARRPFFKRGS